MFFKINILMSFFNLSYQDMFVKQNFVFFIGESTKNNINYENSYKKMLKTKKDPKFFIFSSLFPMISQ